jgi:hypothetical protein
MGLPTNIETFIIDLPWEVTIGGWTGDEFQCSFSQAAQRYYGSEMEVAQYTMIGPDAAFDADFTLLMNRFSFDYEAVSFLENLLLRLAQAIVRVQVQPFVIAGKPTDVPPPIGVGFPLTYDVADYLNNGGVEIPIPLGLFAAFRLLPMSEYAGVTAYVDPYRGEEPPS